MQSNLIEFLRLIYIKENGKRQIQQDKSMRYKDAVCCDEGDESQGRQYACQGTLSVL